MLPFRSFSLALVLTGLGLLPAQAQAPLLLTWAEAAPLPLARYESEAVAARGRLYVFGGFVLPGGEGTPAVAVRRCDAYEPATNTWTRLADMPEPTTHSSTALDGDNVYIAGGFVGNHPGLMTDHVWRYHLPTDTWHAFVPLPAPRGSGTVVRAGRWLHFFGGSIRNAAGIFLQDTPEHWALHLDAPNPAWLPRAPLPNPRNHLGSAALGGKVYAVGGQHLDEEDFGNQADVQEYDPATDRWRAVAPLPRPTGHLAVSVLVLRERLLVVAGVTNRYVAVASVVEYNAAANRWTELTPLPAGREGAMTGVVNGRIVATGGLNKTEFADTWISSITERDTARQLPLAVFPNPLAGHGNLTLQANTPNSEPLQVQLINALGQQVQSRMLRAVPGQMWYQLSLPDLAAGFYTVAVRQQSRVIGRTTLVVR